MSEKYRRFRFKAVGRFSTFVLSIEVGGLGRTSPPWCMGTFCSIGNLGGRPKVYEGREAPAAKESVRRWVKSLSEEDSRRHAVCAVNRYRRPLAKRGLADPDRWVAECASVTKSGQEALNR